MEQYRLARIQGQSLSGKWRVLAAAVWAFAWALTVQAQVPPAQPKSAPPPAPRITAAPEGCKALRNLEYARVGEKSLLLDLYLPEKPDGPLPVVVWIHGGGWRGGDKEPCRAVWLAPRGYAVASVNYRLSQEAIFPAQIQDCKAAIRWLRAHAAAYRLDAGHIGVWGDSAGGHLCALLGASGDVKELEGAQGNLQQSSRVQAVCDFYGPMDLLRFPLPPDPKKLNAYAMAFQFLGGPPEENLERAAQASPITYVTADDPPFLIVHGDRDELVPIQQSELLLEALKKAGVEAELHVVKGAGHGFPYDAAITRLVGEFFDRHLKPPAKQRALNAP